MRTEMEIFISELNPGLKRISTEAKAYGLFVLLCGHRHCHGDSGSTDVVGCTV